MNPREKEVLAALHEIGEPSLAGEIGVRVLVFAPGTQKQAAHRVLPLLRSLHDHGYLRRRIKAKRVLWGLTKKGLQALL